MDWRRPGDKPLSEPMMVSSPTHLYVTWPRWVKYDGIAFMNSTHQVWRWVSTILTAVPYFCRCTQGVYVDGEISNITHKFVYSDGSPLEFWRTTSSYPTGDPNNKYISMGCTIHFTYDVSATTGGFICQLDAACKWILQSSLGELTHWSLADLTPISDFSRNWWLRYLSQIGHRWLSLDLIDDDLLTHMCLTRPHEADIDMIWLHVQR